MSLIKCELELAREGSRGTPSWQSRAKRLYLWGVDTAPRERAVLVRLLDPGDAALLVELLDSYHEYHLELEAKKSRKSRKKTSRDGGPALSSPDNSPGRLWWRAAQKEVEKSPPTPEEKRLSRTKAERLSFKRWRKASEDLPMHILQEEVSYLDDSKAREVMLELSGKGHPITTVLLRPSSQPVLSCRL